LNGVRSHSTATTAVPPKAPLPTEPVRFAVVAATVSTENSPFMLVSVVTPAMAMRSPFFRRWPAVMVATIGVAFVPPVMRMPRAAELIVPRLRCLMLMVLSLQRGERPRNPAERKRLCCAASCSGPPAGAT
jgi:hypothetical protein